VDNVDRTVVRSVNAFEAIQDLFSLFVSGGEEMIGLLHGQITAGTGSHDVLPASLSDRKVTAADGLCHDIINRKVGCGAAAVPVIEFFERNTDLFENRQQRLFVMLRAGF